MVPPASRRISRVLRYSGTGSSLQSFTYEAITPSGWAFLPYSVRLPFLFAGPQPQMACHLVWANPLSLAATEGIVVTFFSSGYLDVSVHRVPQTRLCIHLALTYLQYAVFPHSDIHGSKPACGSPWLFAACHVLHRRLVPGHPPYALVRLISCFFNSYVLLILRPFLAFLTNANQQRFRRFPAYCNWPSIPYFTFGFLSSSLCSCQGAHRYTPASETSPENDTVEKR